MTEKNCICCGASQHQLIDTSKPQDVKLYRKLYKKCVKCNGVGWFWDDDYVQSRCVICACDHGYVQGFEEI